MGMHTIDWTHDPLGRTIPCMKVFITGGSGFVGGHLIERLSKQHEVLAMARSERSAAVVRAYGATAVSADLDTLEAHHLAGVEAVVHCAAFVEEWGTREQFFRANVDGTQRVLDAARSAGVSRFIHIGTEAALFDGHDLIDVDERAPYPAKQRYFYSASKAEAERRVLAAHAEGFATVSLRPRLVWGPRDTSVLPAVLRMAREGAWAWLDGGSARTSTTHVQNLAHAVELALDATLRGEALFVADDGTRTLRDFLSALAKTEGVALPDRSIPGALARPVATAVEGVWRAFNVRKAPPMTAFAIAMMSRTVTVNTARARASIGYAPVLSVDDGLARMPAGSAH